MQSRHAHAGKTRTVTRENAHSRGTAAFERGKNRTARTATAGAKAAKESARVKASKAAKAETREVKTSAGKKEKRKSTPAKKRVELVQHGRGNRFLFIDGYLWMWDTPQERLLQRDLAEKAFGNVLVAGYGLGIIQKFLFENPRVTSVTTVEKYGEVIETMRKTGKIRGNVVVGDFYDFPEGKKFDCVIGDIWPDIDTRFLKDYVKFRDKAQKLLKKDGVLLAWGKEFFEYLLEKTRASTASVLGRIKRYAVVGLLLAALEVAANLFILSPSELPAPRPVMAVHVHAPCQAQNEKEASAPVYTRPYSPRETEIERALGKLVFMDGLQGTRSTLITPASPSDDYGTWRGSMIDRNGVHHFTRSSTYPIFGTSGERYTTTDYEVLR